MGVKVHQPISFPGKLYINSLKSQIFNYTGFYLISKEDVD
jgi:hypothetical protein